MICFIIAMESEAKPLIQNLTGVKTKSVCGRTVVCGKLRKKRVAAVICGVGKVNAAAGTQYAIDVLKAKKIVNFGVAGGLNGGVEVCGLYSVSGAVQYDFDLVQLNGTKIGTLNEYDENYLECSPLSCFPAKKLATGDRFNDDKADYALLTAALNADLRDMEGGAVAHVCKRAGVPFYCFKAVSDLAGSGSTTEQFTQNLERCAEALKSAVLTVAEELNG